MKIGRRQVLGGIAAAWTMPLSVGEAWSGDAVRVLFIGNSFTFEHEIPWLVADIAQQGGHHLQVDMLAEGGAHLADYLRDGTAEEAHARHQPDIVVLQDFSTAALVPAYAEQSLQSIQALCQIYPHATHVLFATWPRRADHRLYRERGMPGTPTEMASMVERHYIDAAEGCTTHQGQTKVARVGSAWMLGESHALHRADRYHASLSGAWLSALVLSRTMGLAPDAPSAPPGVDAPDLLVAYAHAVAP